MLLQVDGSFYIEHGSGRKGWYNARTRPDDAGKTDWLRSRVYRAESATERRVSHSRLRTASAVLSRYLTASVIDYIATSEEYVRWFGSTELLVKFNHTLSTSRAWAGCIEFSSRGGVDMFDIYHELAHHVTIRGGEPYHGERFRGAMLLIASLSPFVNHAHILARQLDKEGLYPHNNKYLRRELFCAL